jgi:high-affinity nickel-transport protein
LLATVSLILLVFVLGLRHGMDADHLAFIDAQTRYNWRMGSPIARYVGTWFAFGHGSVVVGIAVILGMFVHNFKIPHYLDSIVTWISIVALFFIGTLNLFNLISTKSPEKEFQISGIKTKFLPKIMRETTNPFFIVLFGGLFALAVDTVSQTAMWVMLAVNSGGSMPIILGLVFMAGMMLTDTLDSFIVCKMLSEQSKLGQVIARFIGWFIIFLAYGVSFYQAFTFFLPAPEIDFEILGMISFLILLLCFFLLIYRGRPKSDVNG